MTRALALDDVEALAALYLDNREFLAPWQPLRPDSYFSEAGQREAVEAVLAQQASGVAVPLVVLDGIAIVGTVALASIIRGAFQSCSVGYWLGERARGRGLATAALREAVDLAFGELPPAPGPGLDPHAQPALAAHPPAGRVGFEQYGAARQYMHIAGQWQDNVLYQLLTPTPKGS